jgi:hypothetical protein
MKCFQNNALLFIAVTLWKSEWKSESDTDEKSGMKKLKGNRCNKNAHYL